ncbi:MAG: hypothetical protein QM753_05645 [Thermomicrobiales bacterium]
MTLRRFRSWLILLVLCPMMVGVPPALAANDAQPEVVYGVTYDNGVTYASTMAPASTDTIYVLADTTNMLELRRTLVYFWSLTNQYLADWTSLNDQVDGTLEVKKDGHVLTTIPITDYVIQYDQQDPKSTLKVYLGPDASAQAAAFKEHQAAYQQQLVDYSKAEQQWRDEMDALLRATPVAGAPVATPPVRPEKPVPLTLMSTDLKQGFPVTLAEGAYTIQVRDNSGQIIPESVKTVVAYSPNDHAIGYDVVPEQRWTRPERSVEPASTIYTAAAAPLYFQAYREDRVPAQADARMREPQDVSALEGQSVWSSRDELSAGTLRVTRGSEHIADIPIASFYVQQTPGPTLGYNVVPFDAATMDQASFQGFRLDPALVKDGATIELLDVNGEVIPGSTREIRVLRDQYVSMLYGLALLPAVAAAAFWLHQRRSQVHVADPTRRHKNRSRS